MLFRQRERFERTDVPRESGFTNVIGVVVLIAVFIGCVAAVLSAHNYVTLQDSMEADSLESAVSGQSKLGDAPEGFSYTEDTLGKYLFLVSDSSDGEKTGVSLSAAYVLVVNQTQGTATMCSVPVDAEVTSGDATASLSSVASGSGAAACVAPLSAAVGVKFSHVVLSTEDVLSDIVALAGKTKYLVPIDAPELLKVMNTDMSAGELVSLADDLKSIGVSNIQQVEVAASAASEQGYETIDRTAFQSAVGLIVAVG